MQAGLHLHDLVPIIFPDHELIQKLKDELALQKHAFLQRFWQDNGPHRLRHELIAYNRLSTRCSCHYCLEADDEIVIPSDPYEPFFACRLWDRIVCYLVHAGLTLCFPASEPGRFYRTGPDTQTTLYHHVDLENGFMFMRAYTAFPPELIFHAPEPDFNAMTACPYMTPVSDLDAHIVFGMRGATFRFVYGKRLWKQDKTDNPDMTRLDIFREFIREKCVHPP